MACLVDSSGFYKELIKEAVKVFSGEIYSLEVMKSIITGDKQEHFCTSFKAQNTPTSDSYSVVLPTWKKKKGQRASHKWKINSDA